MSEDTTNQNEEKKEDQDQQEQDVEQETKTTTTTTTTTTTKSEDELFLERLTEEAEGCDDDVNFNDTTTTDDLKDLDAIAADFNIDDFDDDMDGELEAVYDASSDDEYDDDDTAKFLCSLGGGVEAMEARQRAMAMLRVAEKPPDKRVEVGSR